MISIKIEGVSASEVAEKVSQLAKLMSGQVQSEPKTETKAEPKTEVKAEAKSEVKSEVKSEPKKQKEVAKTPEPEVKPEPKLVSNEPETKVADMVLADPLPKKSEGLATQMDLVNALQKVINSDAKIGLEEAKKLLMGFGYARMKEVPEKIYGEVVAACEKYLLELRRV